MNADEIEEGKYYELRTNLFFFKSADVATRGHHGSFDLIQGEIVLCIEIAHRAGGEGRGKYAELVVQRGKQEYHLFLRVSRFGRPAGAWREVHPMVVLAQAETLPNW